MPEIILPFDSNNPEFRRGVEVGMILARVQQNRYASETVHADCSEMLIRIAEVFELPFSAELLNDDWVAVTIGELHGEN